MPIIDPTVALAARQEAFCRHYAVSGNAADAARQAGYSERSARQTGCSESKCLESGVEMVESEVPFGCFDSTISTRRSRSSAASNAVGQMRASIAMMLWPPRLNSSSGS